MNREIEYITREAIEASLSNKPDDEVMEVSCRNYILSNRFPASEIVGRQRAFVEGWKAACKWMEVSDE